MSDTTAALAGRRINFAALARSLREEEAGQPPGTWHRRQPAPPGLAAALARYRASLATLEAARSEYQRAKAEHQRSKAALIASRARAGAVLGSTGVEPPDSRG